MKGIKLGEMNTMKVVKEVDFGMYLDGGDEGEILLPTRYVPEGCKPGDTLDVFVYLDQDERPVATTLTPKAMVGEFAYLEVAWTNQFGAFLDWGLPKDLLLPFKEQTAKMKKGDQVLVALYVDKSERLCATMKVYEKLETDSPYKKDDHVEGIVYERSDNFGVFVAVDNKYSALIPKREAYGGHLQVGDKVHARVIKVREDGKLDLSVREKAFIQMDADADLIVKRMEERGGKLPFTDKADPEKIKNELGLSKNAFKRAVGRLLKENKVIITEKSIEFPHR